MSGTCPAPVAPGCWTYLGLQGYCPRWSHAPPTAFEFTAPPHASLGAQHAVRRGHIPESRPNDEPVSTTVCTQVLPASPMPSRTGALNLRGSWQGMDTRLRGSGQPSCKPGSVPTIVVAHSTIVQLTLPVWIRRNVPQSHEHTRRMAVLPGAVRAERSSLARQHLSPDDRCVGGDSIRARPKEQANGHAAWLCRPQYPLR